MVWLTWLWGYVCWERCGAPSDCSIQEFPICSDLRGTKVHARLVNCGQWAPTLRWGWGKKSLA